MAIDERGVRLQSVTNTTEDRLAVEVNNDTFYRCLYNSARSVIG